MNNPRVDEKIDIVVAACEKAVKMVKDLETRVVELETLVQKMRTDLDSAEHQIAAIQTDNVQASTVADIAHWHATGEEDMYNYMMSVKDDTGAELPMSKKELDQKMEAYKKSRADHDMRPAHTARLLRGDN
jgi:outer membrane murein-binding lipoprotein Lpp